MAVSYFYILAGADDGEGSSVGYFSNSGSTIYLGGNKNNFFRFTNVTIPSGAVIISAYINFYAYTNQDASECRVKIYANDVDDAVAPTNFTEMEALALTAGTDWNIPAFMQDTRSDSVDIAAEIQSIVDRPGWASGQALQIIIRDQGVYGSYRDIVAYDLSSTNQAYIHITWAPPTLPISEDATGNDEFVGLIDQLSEEATGNALLGVELPYTKEIDETGNGNDEFIGLIDGIDEEATGNDSFESDNIADIDEEAWGHAKFEIGHGEYTGEISENAWGNDFWEAENPFELNERGNGEADFVGLIDDLDEAATGDDLFQFSYDRAISEDATGDDEFTWTISETLQDGINITDTSEYAFIHALTSELELWDTNIIGWYPTISDSIGVSDSVSHILILLLQEWLLLKDTPNTKLTCYNTVEDVIKINDTIDYYKFFLETLTDSIATSDELTPWLYLVLAEYIDITDIPASKATFYREIADALAATDTIDNMWLKSLVDSISITDSQDAVLMLELLDAVKVIETLSAGMQYNRILEDTIKAQDSISHFWYAEVLESIGFSDLATLIKIYNDSLSDGVNITDTLVSVGTFARTILDQINITDELNHAIMLLITSTIAVADTVSSAGKLYNTISDSITAADTLQYLLTMRSTISDAIVVVDSIASQGTLYNTIQDTLHLNVIFIIDGETWECWVLNTPKFMPSIYTGFNFNSYCEYEGRAFGANETGIFELTGDTDNGSDFHTGVALSTTNFGDRRQKKLRKGYLGVSGGSVYLVMEVEDGTRKAYEVDSNSMANADKDVIGANWKLSVVDFNELDFLELIPVILRK